MRGSGQVSKLTPDPPVHSRDQGSFYPKSQVILMQVGGTTDPKTRPGTPQQEMQVILGIEAEPCKMSPCQVQP